jgi:hypothetical protein
MLPFGFAEVVGFNQLTLQFDTPSEKAALMNQLTDFMILGGYPETIKTREITRNYLSALFDSILLKDITRRFKVRNTNELYNLANYLLANYTNPLSINGITVDLGLGSVHTTQKFCKYLTETYLLFFLPRFNSKLKLMQKADTKIYVVDNGLIHARSFELSPNLGRLLENMVFIELIREGYKAGQTLFYYRSRNDREVDFVCRNGHTIESLIQVSYNIASGKTLKREVDALVEVAGELKCNNLLLISYNDERIIEQKGMRINIIPVWKWLLQKNHSQIPLTIACFVELTTYLFY